MALLVVTVLLAVVLALDGVRLVRGARRGKQSLSVDVLWHDALAAQADVEAKLVALEKARSATVLANDDSSALETEHQAYEAELAFTEAVRHFKVLAIRFRRAVAERIDTPESHKLLAMMEGLERQLPDKL